MALVQIDGRTVEYTRTGRGEAVVLCSPSWWPLDAWALSGVPELADAYDVVTFNQRGVGASQGTPTAYTVESLGADTLALLEALAIPSASLIGFAIGAVIALQAARQAPTRVRGLVLAAAGAGDATASAGVRQVPAEVLAGLRQHGYHAYLRQHALNDTFAFHPDNYRAHPERASALADALTTHAASEEEFLKHVLARQGHRTVDGVEQLSVPTLVLCGAEDEVGRGASTPVQVAHELAARLPRAELTLIPRTRHMLFWESPEVCWARVKQFLAAAHR